jgi:DNA-binding FadR family transcriptional regulator
MTFMQASVSPFKPLKGKKIFEQISDQIRELIFSGTLKPGDKLPSEKELSNQFKTGRTVVREALRTLENAGLIYIKQGSEGGAFIKNIDPTVITRSFSDMIRLGSIPIQDLTEARLGIEKVVLEFALNRITKEDLDLLKMNIDQGEKLISEGVKVTDNHIEFHLLLAKMTKNRFFELILESIMKIVILFLQEYDRPKEYINGVMGSHKEIYKAIEERNMTLAKEKMEQHLLDVKNQFSALLGNLNRKIPGGNNPDLSK